MNSNTIILLSLYSSFLERHPLFLKCPTLLDLKELRMLMSLSFQCPIPPKDCAKTVHILVLLVLFLFDVIFYNRLLQVDLQHPCYGFHIRIHVLRFKWVAEEQII
jgi:hypothetical protein